MKIFASLLSYFPAILQAVLAVQQALAGAPGETKKALVMNALTAAAGVGETLPESHVSGISKLVDMTVATLHLTNMLGFGTKPAAPATPAA